MPDPVALLAVLLAALALDASPVVRIPIGLVAAIGVLAQDVPVVLAAFAAALGLGAGRGLLALRARRAGDVVPSNPVHGLQQAALAQQLRASPRPNQMSFAVAAAPGVPRDLLFPTLGRSRMPLWPALLGTVFGKLPLLIITTVLFAFVATVGSDGDDAEGAVLLGVVAALLLVLRSISAIDWAHRNATGEWRARPTARQRTAAWFGSAPGGAGSSPFGPGAPQHGARSSSDDADDDDIVEGEVLGEEIVDQDDDPGSTPSGRSLPPRS